MEKLIVFIVILAFSCRAQIIPIEDHINYYDNETEIPDGARYPLDNYKSYAWDGLRDNYNYTGTLTSAQETYYNNLRAQTNIGIQNCNE